MQLTGRGTSCRAPQLIALITWNLGGANGFVAPQLIALITWNWGGPTDFVAPQLIALFSWNDWRDSTDSSYR